MVAEQRRLTEVSGGPLSPIELDEFLAQPLLLKLACVRPDGWPYVVPLWYAWHEHKLYVVGRERAVWIGFIQQEPRVGVLVDEDARRHRRVQMTATATVVEGPIPRAQGSVRWQQLNEQLVGRYMADADGRAYALLTADWPRFLVEITPLQITSWRGGPWHRRYYRPEPSEPPPTAVLPRCPADPGPLGGVSATDGLWFSTVFVPRCVDTASRELAERAERHSFCLSPSP